MDNVGSAFSRVEGDSFSGKVFKYKILPLSDLSDKTKRDQKNPDNTGYLTIGNVITVNTENNQIKSGAITRVVRDVNGTPLIVYFQSKDDNKIYSVHALNAGDDDETQIAANDAAPTSPVNQTSVNASVSTLISNIPIFEVLSPDEFKLKHKLFEDESNDESEDEEISYKKMSFEYFNSSSLELSTELINSIINELECKSENLVFLNNNKPDFDKFLESLSELSHTVDFTIYEDKDKNKFLFYSKSENNYLFTEYVEDMELLSQI